jgi:hypothetical protein
VPLTDWLGPDEPWPKHPRPEAEKALAEARGRGWWIKETRGHTFATIVCHSPSDGTRLDERNICRFHVYSTSGDSGQTAKNIRRAVTGCRHGTDEPDLTAASPARRLDQALVLVDRASELLAAAETLARDPARRSQVDELLVEADRRIDQAHGLLYEAIELDREREASYDAAQRTLDQYDLAASPDPIDELVTSADDVLGTAQQLLRGTGQLAGARTARRRLVELREKAKRVRSITFR